MPSTSNSSRLLSVIVPCYNEPTTIAEVVEKVLASPLPLGWEKEIIIVDDGSHEQTKIALQKIEHAAYPNVLVIYRKKNGGKGAAVKEGLGAAQGDYCIIQDADLELDPGDYATLLSPIHAGAATVVFGYRTLAQKEGQKALYFWGGRAISMLYNFCFWTKFKDIPCCYKVFGREHIKALKACPSDDFVFDAIELTREISRGGHYTQVPVSYYPRTHDEGKKLSWVHGVRCAVSIVLLRLGLGSRVPPAHEFLKLGRFFTSGVATVIVNITALYILTEYAQVWYLTSSVIAFCISYGVNFLLQKFWTFQNRELRGAHKQLALHLCLALANLVLNTLVLFALVHYLHLWYIAAQILAVAIIALDSFFLSRLIFAPRT